MFDFRLELVHRLCLIKARLYPHVVQNSNSKKRKLDVPDNDEWPAGRGY